MKRIFLFISLILVASVTVCAQSQDRWTILQDGSIQWKPTRNLPYEDHVEMSGQMLSVVLRYGCTTAFSFKSQLGFSHVAYEA